MASISILIVFLYLLKKPNQRNCKDVQVIPDTRYQIPNTRYQTADTRYQIPDTRYQIPDTRYPIPDTRYQIPDTRYQIPDTRNQILVAKILAQLLYFFCPMCIVNVMRYDARFLHKTCWVNLSLVSPDWTVRINAYTQY